MAVNILSLHRELIDRYKQYIRSFVNIKDTRISSFVTGKLEDRHLWPEPLIQFNPTFAQGISLEALVEEGVLDPRIRQVIGGYNLYRHQEEAIRLGAAGKEFVVTSGTGSGKSLTFQTTIFDYVLRHQAGLEDRTIAVIVYPMNALINSQVEALQDFRLKFEASYRGSFPITFGAYTGQEGKDEKKKLCEHPPHILLTNYMMLELIMTRAGDDVDLRRSILENIRFLAFDELHTYRGRQGADVSMLIRRIRAEATHRITMIGTSATMVSGENATLAEQKAQVADFASLIFGTSISPQQVIGEYLEASLSQSGPDNKKTLKEAIRQPVDRNGEGKEFEAHPTSKWLEQEIALEVREGILVRRKPVTLGEISRKLHDETNEAEDTCLGHLIDILEWANRLNTDASRDGQRTFLPYKLHQFIAQTGTLYASLGTQDDRVITMDPGRYDPDSKLDIYPLVFSRSSGHEFYCVRLNPAQHRLLPREFGDTEEIETEAGDLDNGYLIIQHREDEEPVWLLDRDLEHLPDAWFNPERRDGTRSLKREKASRIPRNIHFDASGDYSWDTPLGIVGWYLPAPLMIDPTSGQIFDTPVGEYTKLMKLGGEGRSTATTVLSFETIACMSRLGEEARNQKLLSFTDNRQDASLQAGHFNDFIRVGRLRSAIVMALDDDEGNTLDFSEVAERVMLKLGLTQEEYARNPVLLPLPNRIRENENALRDFLMYQILEDLRRSWRVVLPNLEQCGMLEIGYKDLSEIVTVEAIYGTNPLLSSIGSSEDRKNFLLQVLDFMRLAYALDYHLLQRAILTNRLTVIREKLKAPWTFEKDSEPANPVWLRIEKLRNNANTESIGYKGQFGRYVRRVAARAGAPIHNEVEYTELLYQLMDFLEGVGLVMGENRTSASDEQARVYRLRVDAILWLRGDDLTIRPDQVKTHHYRARRIPANAYFRNFYKTRFDKFKPIEGREHTGQIEVLTRRERERRFREGAISTLFCSPTMELGIDISELSIVHMRNVPPSPANYAQRSGRAGRSGQAALVMVYCSNFSAHDRHFFKDPARMVAGSVVAPRMDLINEELLESHLHALILTRYSLHGLSESISGVLDTEDLVHLPLKRDVREAITLDDQQKSALVLLFGKVIADELFRREMNERKPAWFNDRWIRRVVANFPERFDRAMDRWRILYRSAKQQFNEANDIIGNTIYADDHPLKKEARTRRRNAERELALLANNAQDGRPGQISFSEFYPYRYLASEGFLPGYGFTRLPLRTFLESYEGAGEYVSRPRVIALREFGPRNVIYHNGTKYRIDKMIVPEAEAHIQRARVSPHSGYILRGDQYNFTVDPILDVPLEADMDRHTHVNLLEMAETKATEMQRINCQEEERARRGYRTKTYFAVEGNMADLVRADITLGEDKLLHLHTLPAARLVHLNFGWKDGQEDGFTVDLRTGSWQNRASETADNQGDHIRRVKLFATDTANALYLQPVNTLGLEGGQAGVITLMYALKKAIEQYFQVESSEIGVQLMGETDVRNILVYESAEGSLGVLSQMVEDPDSFRGVMHAAFDLCFMKEGREIPADELVPATYDDLLSYYNQHHHEQIDRNLVREALRQLRESSIEVVSGRNHGSYEEHYSALQAARDPSSTTEEIFLRYLYDHGIKLPDEAQPLIDQMYVRPDFLYNPKVCIFCDGSPHDRPDVIRDDDEKRTALANAGYQVLTWHYRDSLEEFIGRRPDIFKRVR